MLFKVASHYYIIIIIIIVKLSYKLNVDKRIIKGEGDGEREKENKGMRVQ